MHNPFYVNILLFHVNMDCITGYPIYVKLFQGNTICYIIYIMLSRINQ